MKAAVLAFAPLLLLAGCSREVLDPAGDIALQQRNLIYTSTGLMLLIIVPVIVLIIVFAWRYRSGNREATYDPDFDHSTSLELAIWAGPLLIIIALGALTWSSTHLLDPFRPLDRIAPGKPTVAGEAPLTVQVVAMDWKWLFIYPEQGIATVNELVLPVDRRALRHHLDQHDEHLLRPDPGGDGLCDAGHAQPAARRAQPARRL